MLTFTKKTVLVSFFRVCSLLVVAAALLFPASAIAREDAAPAAITPATSTATDESGPDTQATPTTATATSGAEEEGDESKKSETDDTWIAVAFIVFAGFSVLVLFWYLGYSQNNFFKSVSLVFGKTGVVPEAVAVPAIPRSSLVTEDTVPIKIKGPGAFQVGEAVTFSATSDGAPISVDWSITPAESVAPASAVGAASITFKASAQATLTITAKDPGGKGEEAVQASATAPEPARPSLPFIGENYGAALIAIVAVAGVVVLGLTDAIKGEAIATFFGALLGYAFGKGVQSSQSGTGTTANSGGDAPE